MVNFKALDYKLLRSKSRHLLAGIKRNVFWRLLMLLLLIIIIWLAGNNQGYVLVVRSPYRVQFSFNFLLILVVLSFLGLHYFLRFILFLRRLPANRRRKKEAYWLKEGNAALIESLHALIDNDFIKAEEAARRAQKMIQNPALEKLGLALTELKINNDARQSNLFK